jgi:hypothetical protein
MTDYKALCAELLDEIPHESPLTCMARAALAQSETEKAVNWAAYFARQAAAQEKELQDALAQPEPEGPTKAEIHALADELLDGDRASRVDFARAVLARWGNL